MLTSQEIANKKFDRARFGGYQNEQVDTFLDDVVRSFEELEEQNAVLTKKLEVLADKLEEYRNDEESLRTALLGAQKLGDSIVRESKNKSEIILRDATIKAERIINTAHDQIEKEKMVYIKLQKDVAAFKNKLLAIYKQHLELISNLPDDPDKQKAKKDDEAEGVPSEESAAEVSEQAAREDHMEEQERPEIQEEEPKAPVKEEAAPEYEEDYEEPKPRRKFIPVPGREPNDGRKSQKSPYADEYYEDFEDEDEPESAPQQPSSAQKKSKFGTLKFGAGYDLKRD